MRSRVDFEHILERNALVASTSPLEILAAQRHFHALVREVELNGREYELQRQGILVGRLVPADEEGTDDC